MLRPVAETTSIFYWDKSMVPERYVAFLPCYFSWYATTNSGKKWIDYIF